MNTEQLIDLIQNSPKKTQTAAFVCSEKQIPGAFNQILLGEKEEVLKKLEENREWIKEVQLVSLARNSALDLMDFSSLNARIEYGAVIRDHVEIKDHAIIMMGALLNAGCHIGEGTMIDMGAVIGARAYIKDNCHIGANAVIAGVLEPPSAQEVIIEDNVMVGAGAVVLEGVHIHQGAVVAAGAVVIEDIPENCVAAGCPAKIIKRKDKKTELKTQLLDALREL